MNENRRDRVDLLLHPVRIRIVGEFAGHQRSVRDLAAALPDVPQATLYRQVGVLVEGGVLEQVDRRSTAGADERVYRVAEGADSVPATTLDGLSPEEHRRYFGIFTASLIDALAAYVTIPGATPSEDGLSYNRIVVHLDDAERDRFAARFGELVAEVMAVPPDPGRRGYLLASCVIPAPGWSS
jgi:hypothetical protein